MCAVSIGAAAQEMPRIGVVNLDRIMREATAVKAAQQKIEQEFARRDKELQETAGRVKQLAERLDRDAAVLADGERTRRQREVSELDREFQRRRREFQEDFNQRRNEELASIIERANRVIRQIAEQEKYDLIVQDAVYASPRVDMTEKVLRALNAPR
ncbi:MAG TPA: OmpH family outer membrane protein [Burkholderiaceae bacterium]|nr:OmpH family outer membrane protein [Burkholderiaceae bacterium]